MNVEHEEPGKLKIFLGKDDMQQLDITFDQLDYNNAKTRKALWTILSDAGAASSFIVSGSKLLIEVFPAIDNGCIIYFTLLKKEGDAQKRLRLKRPNLQPTIFEFSNSEEMLTAMDKLSHEADGKIDKSDLYQFGDKYRLIVFLNQNHMNPLLALLNEYGKNAGQSLVQVAYTQEHGRLLAHGNAVELVSGPLSREASLEKTYEVKAQDIKASAGRPNP